MCARQPSSPRSGGASGSVHAVVTAYARSLVVALLRSVVVGVLRSGQRNRGVGENCAREDDERHYREATRR